MVCCSEKYCKFEWLVRVEIVEVVAAPRLRFEKVVLRNFHERSNSIPSFLNNVL